PVGWRQAEHLDQGDHRHGEREHHRADCDVGDVFLAEPSLNPVSRERVGRKSQQGEERDQPQITDGDELLRTQLFGVFESLKHAEELGPQKFVTVGYLWLIPFFPLLGFATNAFAGHWIQRRFGKKYVSYIAVGAMVLSFAVAMVALIQMLGLPPSDR